MAKETVNQPTHGVSLNDADALGQAAQKLNALLMHTYGESGEAFRNMNNSLQDTYLWACGDLASEIERLSNKLEGLS